MTIRMYGTGWCSDCKRAKQFFAEQRVPYEFVDVDSDEAGRAVVQEHNGGKDIIPLYRDAKKTPNADPKLLAALTGRHRAVGKRRHRYVRRRPEAGVRG